MNKKLFYCAFALLPLAAFSDPVNLKPGLWETTSTMDVGGAQMPAMPSIPPETLAKLPPEQRAQMEAMLARRGGTGNAQVTRSCVTEKDLQRGFKPPSTADQSCKADSLKSTATTQEVHIACTSARGNTSGVFKLTATSREAYEGSMDTTAVVQNRPMNIKMKMKGKWLGADCGDVKPMAE